MMARHVIGKLTIEVEARQQTEAYEQQQTVSGWVLSDSLWRDLSTVFDRLVPDDVVVTIPQLELTVGARSEEALRSALTDALRDAIGQIVQTRDGQRARFVSARQHSLNQVQYYLETGRLLWSMPATAADSITDWFRQLSDAPDAEFVLYLREKAGTNSAIWLRFVHALGLKNVGRFVLTQLDLSAENKNWLAKSIDHQLPIIPFSEQTAFWRILFQHTSLAQLDEAAFMHIVRVMVADYTETDRRSTGVETGQSVTNDRAEPAPTWSDAEAAAGDGEETLHHVANAGLVLLWQFVPPLFRWLGLVEDGYFRDEDARCRGIHLLQYIVTGETDAWEHALPLNKVLCQWNMERPVPRTAVLTAQDYEGADKLLLHVLEKWPVIRSVEALRTTFLQRSGTLTPSPEGGWRLQVERKTVDILMVRPPKRPTEMVTDLADETTYPGEWGFSVVKFSWMDHLLFVDW